MPIAVDAERDADAGTVTVRLDATDADRDGATVGMELPVAVARDLRDALTVALGDRGSGHHIRGP